MFGFVGGFAELQRVDVPPARFFTLPLDPPPLPTTVILRSGPVLSPLSFSLLYPSHPLPCPLPSGAPMLSPHPHLNAIPPALEGQQRKNRQVCPASSSTPSFSSGSSPYAPASLGNLVNPRPIPFHRVCRGLSDSVALPAAHATCDDNPSIVNQTWTMTSAGEELKGGTSPGTLFPRSSALLQRQAGQPRPPQRLTRYPSWRRFEAP